MRRIPFAVIGGCALLCLTAALVCADEERSAMERNVRKPAVAGQFYTADPQTLRREIESYIAETEIDDAFSGEVIAIVSPHAGYMYSGGVAAHGYRLLRGKEYETVVVIAPSHVEYFDFCSVFAGDAYLTPLGEIPIDRKMVDLITSKHDLIRKSEKGHAYNRLGRGEHSLEVQLPFLQVALGQFDLVPIVMGSQDFDCVRALGETLGEVLSGRKALIVASTDLSHFHSDQRAKSLDGVFIEALQRFEPETLRESIHDSKTEACGGGPTMAAMIAAKILGADRCSVLSYATSGDVTGDRSSVVGYVSAAMFRASGTSRNPGRGSRSAEESPGAGSDSFDIGLTPDDKSYLLRLARGTIEAHFGEVGELPPHRSPVLDMPCGAFVTLSKKGKLRGCIGYIEAVKPLRETISEMASSAAFKDWRFPPVRESELSEIEIEISVLSPLRRIEDPTVIEVGTHGIVITRGPSRGLLLPQVAVDWNWDRETFLRQTCVKAGLPEDAWTIDGTNIDIFSADIFSERELGLRQ
jgi:AmmeMemoRadiSam system protein B/AmmeMemoRadiSam system protein A